MTHPLAHPAAATSSAAPAGLAASGRLEGVRRIAVLRGGGLGDLLFAEPAMRALAAAYPEAELTLLGAPVATALLGGRAPVPHRILELPRIPGVNAPGDAAPPDAELVSFLAERRAERYDLAVQLHGGGRFSNPFLLRIGARCTVGARTPDAAPLDRSIDYVYYQHEVLRALEIAGLAGAAPVELEPRVAVAAAELAAARRRFGAERPVAVIHPGATDPRRRWPLQSFAEVAAGLADAGARVVIVGSEGERALCARLAALAAATAEASAGGRAVAERIVDASGALELRRLAALLAHARVLVGNDSGPRHLAQAVGTATASVYWFGNLINAGPFGRGRHRVQISWTTRCPVCGRDCTQVGWTAERCEHDVSFVADVPVAPVLQDARRLFELGGADRA